jgi:hypothetical protein
VFISVSGPVMGSNSQPAAKELGKTLSEGSRYERSTLSTPGHNPPGTLPITRALLSFRSSTVVNEAFSRSGGAPVVLVSTRKVDPVGDVEGEVNTDDTGDGLGLDEYELRLFESDSTSQSSTGDMSIVGELGRASWLVRIGAYVSWGFAGT